jgi:two-component system, NarL family, sensor histidine kinase UhpB
MKKAAAFTIGVCLAYCCLSQNLAQLSTAELREQLLKTTSGKQKADICFWLSWRYSNVLKMDSARYFKARLKELTEAMDYELGTGMYFFVNGRLSFLVREFAACDSNYKRALGIFTKYNDTLLLGMVYKFIALNQMGLFTGTHWLPEIRKNLLISIEYLSKLPVSGDLAHAYQVLGNEYVEVYEIDSAVYYLVAAIRCAEKSNSHRVHFNARYHLGELYITLNDWDKAYEHFQQAMTIPADKLDKVILRACLGAYAICLIEKKDYALADKIIGQYIEMNKLLGDEFGNIKLLSLNAAYAYGKGNYHIAVKNFSESFKRFEEFDGGEGFELVDIVFRLGRAEHKTGDYVNAIRHFRFVLQLASKIQYGVYIMNSNFELAQSFKALNRIDSSFYYLAAYAHLRDSLLPIQKQRAVVELIAKYETEKKEQQIKLLENEKQLQTEIAAREGQRKNFAYSIIAAILFFGSFAFVRFIQHKRMSKKLATSLAELKQTQVQLIRIEKEKEAENIRSSISRDIHDEVGSTLSGVALFSEIARQKMKEHKDSDVTAYLEHISSNSKEMVQKMSDIVWAINPENDSFGRIMTKLQAMAMNLCAGKNIRLQTNIDKNILDEHPEMNDRKNLYLFVKEALNNAVKYSSGKNLCFSLKKRDDTIIAEITDDGKGFDPIANAGGNGLNNMRIRAQELNGVFTLDSCPGKGTVVRLEFNFHPAGGHRIVV